ncbi:MAG TPA: galactokinase [Nocardioides sp.]|nr:galactokinase [Nocardioides sp.]
MPLVASAPGRVNLIGEHTDYNRGLCLPLALPQRTTVRVSARADDRLSLSSAQADEAWEGSVADRPDGWAAYVAGVVAELRAAGLAVPGLDLTVDSEVPLGAGLSSSAALECAVATAAAGLLGLDLADDGVRRGLADACIAAENDYVGAPTGGMDQTVAMLGRPGHALLLDFADGGVTPIPLPLDAVGLTLLVIDTRVSHTLTDGSYGDRRSECADAARALGVGSLRDVTAADLDRLDDEVLRRRARHIVTENARVREAASALAAGDWDALAAALDASHVSMRDDFEISCGELDLAVETAQAAGARGARMTGGGFGGSALALVPASSLADVRRAVTAAFADAGFRAPAYLLATPSGGARVDARD